VANNTYSPFGFQESRLWNSSVPNYAINGRSLAYNYGSQIARGDPVFLYTDGTLHLYVVGGTTIDGIAYGVNYFDPNNILSGAFHPAWTAPTLSSGVSVTVKVQTDPSMVFIAQADGAALTQASVGLNIDIVSGSSGAPTSGSGLSTCGLDATNVHATATLPFRIVGILGITPGFDSYGFNVPSGYVPTNGNQYLAVTMNTQDMPAGTRSGQA
jgi:hypothetical protein